MHCVLCAILVLCIGANIEVIDVKVHTGQAGGHVIGTYVGATLDQGDIKDWETELTNIHLINAAKAVPGVIVRIGGTEADWTYFNTSTAPDQHQELTTKMVDTLCAFVKGAKWKMVFGLNALARKNGTDPWDPTNAKSLLEYFGHIGCFEVIEGFELGNEPDAYPSRHRTVTPQRMAKDFIILRGVLEDMNIPKHSANIWGPDVAGSSTWFAAFLDELHTLNKLDILNGATFHQYYFDGRKSTPQDYVEPKNLDKVARVVQTFKAVAPKGSPDLIFGETGPSYGGGLKGVTAGYGVTMMWLDKLGSAPRNGLTRVQRQTFWGGNYGLMNGTNVADPDYFIWNIYRNQTTTTNNNGNVLVVDGDTAKERTVRVYARCTAKDSILVSVINVDNNDKMVRITPTGTYMDVWKFHSGCASDPLVCQTVKINGNTAQSGPSGEIPLFPGHREMGNAEVRVDSMTSAIIVIHGVNAPACV